MEVKIIDSYQVADSGQVTSDGYMVFNARVARIGIQDYLSAELGIPSEKEVLRVYRPEEAVFHVDSLKSYAHRPVTLDHPKSPVTADTWKQVAVGQTGDEVVRDGDYVRVPLVLMDREAIDRVNRGERELSMGYSCQIELQDGVTPGGEAYDAVMTELKMNHLAVVARARGGSNLRLGDSTDEDDPMTDKTIVTKTVLVDGLTVETTDAGAVAIEKLQAQLADANKAKADLADAHSRELAKKDAEIDDLKKKVFDEAAVNKLIADRAMVYDAARRILPDIVVEGKSLADIRREVVVKKIGDSVKGKDDAYIEARFDALLDSVDVVRDAFLTRQHVNPALVSDSDKAYMEHVAGLNSAWMGESKKAN